MNFKNIFKKNQIIIYTLVLMLISAGYLNYTNKMNAENVEVSTQGDLVENHSTQDAIQNGEEGETKEITAIVPNEEKSKNNISNNVVNNKTKDSSGEKNEEDKKIAEIGDATLVSSNDVIADDYFVKSKIERESMYSQMQETYQSILDNNNSSEAQKEMAVVELARINETKKCIMICENLLETKGFKNCVIFVNEGSVNVIIENDELKQEQTAQIQNIISRELGAIVENIHISVKK